MSFANSPTRTRKPLFLQQVPTDVLVAGAGSDSHHAAVTTAAESASEVGVAGTQRPHATPVLSGKRGLQENWQCWTARLSLVRGCVPLPCHVSARLEGSRAMKPHVRTRMCESMGMRVG